MRLFSGRRRRPVLPFPTGIVAAGIIPAQLTRQLVQNHEARVGAVFFQVALFQKARVDGLRLGA